MKRAAMDPLPVNPDLVWDYDLPPGGEQTEAFRRWYVGRVLTRGRASDVRALGLTTIRAYLPDLVLPAHIRRAWEWYFNLPLAGTRDGHTDPAAAPVPGRDRPKPAAK